MNRIVHGMLLMAGMIVAMFFGPFAHADDMQQRFEDMQRQLDALRQENAEMRSEMSDMRRQHDEGWLTERRATEIRQIVSDMLADADTRSASLSNGMTAGWNEHFFLASPDGRFFLQLDGQFQFRWVTSFRGDADRWRSGFEPTRTKITLRGHVFNPDLTYLIRTNFTRNEPGLVTGLYYIEDAWLRYRLNDEWSVRAGRFKLPFNREELVSSALQLLVERSLVNENTNLGRNDGIELTYSDDVNRWRFMFSDGAMDNIGGFNAVGNSGGVTALAALTEDVEYAFTMRYETLLAGNWNQFEDFTSPVGEEFAVLVGAAIHYEETEYNGAPSFSRNETRWLAWTADVSVEFGGATLFGSFTHNYVDAPTFLADIFGIVVQGGVYLTPKLEGFLRWEYGWWETSVTDFVDLHAVTVGTNYYIDGHDVKWTTDFGYGLDVIDTAWDSDIAGWRQDTSTSNPQLVLRTQIQLLF
jgi:hypothetical protein